ncbi:MAG: SH3 domain-containing protein [Pseudomonadota bacterium]
MAQAPDAPAAGDRVAAGSAAATGASGRKVPRYVSLKASRVNLRKGPGMDYPTAWVFRRAGLPVEVVREYARWREVRDAEGTTGWVSRSLLSARRTGQIAPWSIKAGQDVPQMTLRSRQSDTSRAVAIVEAGVIADLHACDGTWCRVSVASYRGFIRQKDIWGIYPDETFD